MVLRSVSSWFGALRVVSVGGLESVNEILNRLHSLSVLPHPLALREEGLEASQPTANLEGVSALPECILSP